MSVMKPKTKKFDRFYFGDEMGLEEKGGGANENLDFVFS